MADDGENVLVAQNADRVVAFESPNLQRFDAFGCPLHATVGRAVVFIVDFDVLGRHVNVEIETEGRFTTGMTVADWWQITDRPKNAMFMREIDADAFFDLLTTRLARL